MRKIKLLSLLLALFSMAAMAQVQTDGAVGPTTRTHDEQAFTGNSVQKQHAYAPKRLIKGNHRTTVSHKKWLAFSQKDKQAVPQASAMSAVTALTASTTAIKIRKAPEDNVITEVRIYGYEPPVAGEASAAHLNLTVPDGVNYSIDYSSTPIWYDDDTSQNFYGTFVEGTSYSMGMTLKAADGYTFASGCKFYINDDESIVDYTYTKVREEDNTLANLWSMPVNASATPSTVITEVRIYGYEPPVAGEASADHLNITVPDGVNYSIDYSSTPIWYDDDGSQDFYGTFVEGTSYSMGVQLKAADGYTFASGCKFYINDDESIVDYTYTKPDAEDNTLAYLWSMPVKATSALSTLIDFETGDLSQYPFVNDTEYPWTVTSSDAASGTYSMMSGNKGVASSTSAISATYVFTADGHISFDAKCMGEGTNSAFDACIFYIDGEQQFKHGADVAEKGWMPYAFPVAAGTHTFKWEYSKDGSVNDTGDAFFVDNIEFGIGNPFIPAFDLAAKRNANNVLVSWQGISDSFTLRYRLSESDTWTTVSDITETNYTLTDLTDGTYVIEVQAVGSEPDTWVSTTVTFKQLDIQSTANWFGYTTYAIGGEDWTGKFIRFTMQDPATVRAASADMSSDSPYASAYVDGYVWFIPSTGTNKGKLCRSWLGNKFKTLVTVETVVADFEEEGTAIAMAYNPADGKIYYLSSNDDNVKLKCFDPKASTIVSEEKGTFSFKAQTLAINSEGEAYSLNHSGSSATPSTLYRVNLSDATTTEVGSTGVPVAYVQSMAFDLETGELFWTQIYDANNVGLYQVDPETGNAVFMGQIGSAGTEVAGLFMVPTVTTPPVPDLSFTPFADLELTYGSTEGDVAGNKAELISGMPEPWADDYNYTLLYITNTNLVNVADPNDQLVMALTVNGDPAGNLKYYSPLMVDGQEIEYSETNYSNEFIRTLAGQTLEYIYIDNYGTEEDFAKVKDVLADKIAICNRGSISFYVKANAAMANGAAGIIVVNNQEGVVNMNLTGYEYDKPAVSIKMADGTLLKEKGEFVDGEAPYYVGTLEIDEVVAGHNEFGLGFGRQHTDGSTFPDYEIKAWVPDWTNATPGATYKATITYPSCSYEYWNDDIEAYGSYPVEIGTPSTTLTVVIPEDTGIDDVNADLRKDGHTYNLMGIRVGKDYKGIVIKNGKKVLQ